MTRRPPAVRGKGRTSPSRSASTSNVRPPGSRTLRPPVVVVGFGRLGGALALQLSEAGWPITVSAASEASRRAAKRYGLALADDVDLAQSAMALIVVRDDAVHDRARALMPQLGQTTALVHCAGALPLSVLGSDAEVTAHPRGSFHPLAAVSSPQSVLAGKSVALSGTTPRLLTLLRRMARDLALRPFEVSEAHRAAYHAGAVLSAGGAVALLATAVQAFGQAGVREEEALHALLPLMRSALDGVEARGLSKGLTGPVPRGDAAVVEAHLEALPPSLRAIYRELSEQMLALSELPPPQHTRLKRVLRASEKDATTRSSRRR